MIKNLIIKIKKKLRITNDIKEYRKQGIIIGENTHILGCTLDQTHPHLIEIGNNCTLTHCTVLTHDASTKKPLGKSKIGMVEIGNNCFIGYGSIILPGVKIGNDCIVGAGSVVGKDIPDNSVVVGNPCQIIKRTDEYLKKHKDNMKKYPNYNVIYSKMTPNDRKKQKEELKTKRKGYDK